MACCTNSSGVTFHASLAVALAFLTHKSALKRTILICSAVPVAIMTNMFRVIATGVLASRYGGAVAEGFFHDFAGFAVFALAMVILFGESALLKKVGR